MARAQRTPDLTGVQSAILDAARVLFARQGYEGTTINDIGKLSGVSVGSIYHWFGGKSDVFIAMVEQILGHHAALSEAAVKAARAGGENRPSVLFIMGARAYLFETWEQRAISRVLFGGDVPGKFNKFSYNVHAMLRQRSMPLRFGTPPLPECDAFAATGLLHAAAMQLTEIEDEALARDIIDYFAGLLLRLAASAPVS